MSRFEHSIKSSIPANKHYSVRINARFLLNNEYMVLTDGKESISASIHITTEEFYAIIEDVVNIFNKIGESRIKGYNFYVTGSPDISGCVDLTFNMCKEE